MKQLFKLVSAIALAIALNIGLVPVFVGLGVGQALACTRTVGIDCNRVSTGVPWRGKGRMPNLIHNVTVCDPYFDRLNIGTYRGVRTRWWAPTMVRAGWFGDLPVYTTQCTTFKDFTPGTEIRIYASCVSRVIKTVPIYKPGTYYMN